MVHLATYMSVTNGKDRSRPDDVRGVVGDHVEGEAAGVDVAATGGGVVSRRGGSIMDRQHGLLGSSYHYSSLLAMQVRARTLVGSWIWAACSRTTYLYLI